MVGDRAALANDVVAVVASAAPRTRRGRPARSRTRSRARHSVRSRRRPGRDPGRRGSTAIKPPTTTATAIPTRASRRPTRSRGHRRPVSSSTCGHSRRAAVDVGSVRSACRRTSRPRTCPRDRRIVREASARRTSPVVTDGRYRIAPRSPRRNRPARNRSRTARSRSPSRSAASAARSSVVRVFECIGSRAADLAGRWLRSLVVGSSSR